LAKIECQKQNKLTIARIHREIESWAKTQKENYYKNWYLVEKGKLDDSLKRGLLTQTQYKEKLTSLEKTWAGKMSYINGQVKEKIKLSIERAEACGKIKDCEKIYLQKVLDILGKTRYKKWIECHKYNYKRK
jgi:Rps23 Pro-64 3,4-dihydroxylase Tpa1-like proline 4-hydroxylase